MKRTLPIALLFLTSQAFAQDKKTFTGFGIFQIGSDTSVIYKYAADMNAKIMPSDNSEGVMLGKIKTNSRISVFRLFRNAEKAKNYRGMSYCADVEEFYLTSFTAEGIEMRNINLKYYKDKLIYVECTIDKRLLDNLSARYGRPKVSSTTDPVSCTGPDGKQQGLTSSTTTLEWHIDNIGVRGVLQKTYDEQCKQVFHGTFSYATGDKAALDCENAAAKTTE